MLTATLVTCMKSPIGHIAEPKIQCPSMALVKLRGMQKKAIQRSETAKLIKYLAKTDFDLLPVNIT